MTVKQAQFLDGVSVSTDDFMEDENFGDFQLEDLKEVAEKQPMEKEDLVMMDDSFVEDSNDLLAFEVDEGNPNVRTFILPAVPGGEFQGEIDDEVDIEVDDEDEIVVDDDPFKWKPANFLDCLKKMLNGVPSHSGQDSPGLERAISYLEMVNKEISKAMRSDYKGEIDWQKVKEAREEIMDGIKRLKERLEKIERSINKKKKTASFDGEMIKEATKAAHIGNHVVSVPLIISHVARTCLNSMISSGKDIEDTFDKLAAKYNFTPREEAETMQLLADMGYPMRRPRGYDRDEEIDYTSTDNFDWMSNYPG